MQYVKARLRISFEPAAVSSYMGSIVPFLNVDGDGKVDPLTGGVRIVRYLWDCAGLSRPLARLRPAQHGHPRRSSRSYLN